jgi:hypothetical protein
MPKYIDVTSKVRWSVAICDRCRFKFAYDDLSPDGDKPGMRVCEKCNDEKDPWALPPRRTEDITLRHPRPDESVTEE